ncbi:ATP-binding protein [Pseudomaricurvus sp. HS19]|uniref:ATP-binding protein n=1 Tax=Pseudomaricurvus sp. HS19 TaxID=2692626 RepID=UPI001368C59C|nr:ATP-binding protein [Pseudomaricurvus sp. HS19]
MLARLWPRKLLGQMILLVVLALLLAQGINLWLLSEAHERALRYNSERFIVRQFASAVAVIEQTPSSLHRSVLRAWQRPGGRYQLTGTEPELPEDRSSYARELREQLLERLGGEYAARTKVSIDEVRFPERDAHHRSEHRPPDTWFRYRPRPPLREVRLAVQLNGGDWLVTRQRAPDGTPMLAASTFIFLSLALLMVIAVVFWQMRRITRPLQRLARAAEDLGRGKKIPPLLEEGPEDISHTVSAFNSMNHRIERFVSERTQMLAALSHDLRTPITAMRLRLELMADSEEKDKLLRSLEEMQQMSEATLAFVRQSGDGEATRPVDINALLGSLCDDLQEMGMAVEWQEGEPVVLEVRPVSLKRALRNLLENAVKYGSSAKASMTATAGWLTIEICDQGPGIPEEQLEAVFEPFRRIEQSRNRGTGGTGLGLSIARQIVTSHGGSLTLHNADTAQGTGAGLIARVRLPR